MYKRALLCVLFALCAAWANPVCAQGRYARDPYGPEVQPLDRLLPTVRHAHPGRFYDAEGPFPDPAGGYHYRLKWLTPEGRVIWFDTDAHSGRVMGYPRSNWREQGAPPVMPGYGPPPYGPGIGYGRPPGNRFGGPPGRPYGGPGRGGFGFGERGGYGPHGGGHGH